MVSFKKTGPGYDTNENGASNLNIYFASSRIVSLSVGKIASRLICKKKKTLGQENLEKLVYVERGLGCPIC